MLSWRVVLTAIVVFIVAVLMFFFFVPFVMESIGSVVPYFFYEFEESIRCHLFQSHGICLSMYPNPVEEGKEVDVTFRTIIWHDGRLACVADYTNNAAGCCTIEEGKCKTEFEAEDPPAKTYFAFIDNNENNEWNLGMDEKGEEKILRISGT